MKKRIWMWFVMMVCTLLCIVAYPQEYAVADTICDGSSDTMTITGITFQSSVYKCYLDEVDENPLDVQIETGEGLDQEIARRNAPLVWTSSNESAAFVADDGVLCLIDVGTTVITCSCESNPNIYAQCLVKVYGSRSKYGYLGDGEWSLEDDGTLTITGNGPIPNFNEIDIQWNGFEEDIKRVIIQEGVTSIGNYTFKGCTNLKSIVIYGNLMSIGDCAFEECTNLEGISISGNLISIGNCAFKGCTAMESMTISGSLTKIGNYAFEGCTSLLYITLPKVATSIGNHAFEGCTSLKRMTIPVGITSISSYAFKGCTNLESIMIPGSVTSVGDYAFDECYDFMILSYPRKYILSYAEANNIRFELLSCGDKTHYPGTITIENKIESICSKTGSYDEVYYCVNCEVEMSRTQKTIAKKDHTVVADPEVAATCTESGKTAGKHCSVCNTVLVAQKTVAPKGHTAEETVIPASTKNDGSIVKKCNVCHNVIDTTVIPKAYITVEETAKYTGKAVKQAVKVTDTNGKAIPKTYYTVAYKNNVKAGKATITITFNGNYSGKENKTFTIVYKEMIPAKVSGLKLIAGKKAFTVGWKIAKNADGYEIQYSTDKKFLNGVKTVKITKAETVTKVVSKLKTKNTYYVRIRAYNKEGKTTAYSVWSTAKVAKIK